MSVWIPLVLLAAAAVVLAGAAFSLRPAFGRLPRGERLARIERSARYRDGEFRNPWPTPLMTSRRSRAAVMLRFLLGSKKGLRPAGPVPAMKCDLAGIDPAAERFVWFGHSSYLIQTGGKRLLVDPVFESAAPVSFANRPFAGTDIFRAADMPAIDYLIITHDHWDHLDHGTVTALRTRIGRVVCPLGVGAHLEYWGFEPERIVEMDWEEEASFDDGFRFRCLPARHFSGRGLRSNRTLWASFLVASPVQTIFAGGDGGYGPHFAEIGRRFRGIDLAVLENGQYNEDWRSIHTLPDELPLAADDLGAAAVVTVHHSKYALARHRWDEPPENARRLAAGSGRRVLLPRIGEVMDITPERSTNNR